MTPQEQAELEAFVLARRWRWAKTWAKTAPHWYTVRAWSEDSAAFDRAVEIICSRGYDRAFRGRSYRSIDLDGFTYWPMDQAVPKATVINRIPARWK